MKRDLLFSLGFLIFLSSSLYSQTLNDSLNILYSQTWKTSKGWFGEDVVILTPREELKYELGMDPKYFDLRKRYRSSLGEWITFSSDSLNYQYRMTCPVGAELRTLTSFNLSKGIVTTTYQIYMWDEAPSKTDTARYHVTVWTKDRIVLKREVK